VSTYRRLLRYLSPYRGRLALAIGAMLILAATTGLYPLLLDLLTTYLIDGEKGLGHATGPTIDRVGRATAMIGAQIDADSVRQLVETHLLLLFGAVVMLKAISQAVRFYQMGMIAQWIVRDLRRDLFSATLRQSEAFFGDQATGFLVSRVINDVSQVERAATYAVPVIFGDVLKVLALAAVCIGRYLELSLVAMVVAPIAVLPIVRFGRVLKRVAKDAQEELGKLTHRVTETIGGVRVVHAYGREAHELDRFDKDSADYVDTMRKSVIVRAVQTPVMELIGVLALLLTIGYAMSRTLTADLRAGEVVGFLLALVLLYEPLKAIGRVSGIVVPGVASAERIFEVIDRVPDIRDRVGARPLDRAPELVRFESVGFRYRQSGDPVLDGLDIVLPRGRIIALAGPSGGGKSTIAALLLRFFDVTSGRVTFDGVDIRDLSISSLRSQIALVAQETFLFNDTVRANIAYGLPVATDAQIVEAAKRAHAHDFISLLPQGYDTITGERGIQLSGGQRQRIAIARAFLRDAPILILDEATSSLDAESEREVQLALDRLLQNRTALVIAHRLSTIRHAHEILVLDKGRVIERGSHAELLEHGALYARLIQLSEGAPCT
jgi:subfamily B ATP-binding cassette protein MsbA